MSGIRFKQCSQFPLRSWLCQLGLQDLRDIESHPVAVFERILVVFILPMAASFWLARGVSLLVLYAKHSRQGEINSLRDQVETLEAVRRANLTASHLARMTQTRRRESRQSEGCVRGGMLFANLAVGQMPSGDHELRLELPAQRTPSGLRALNTRRTKTENTDAE